jgi:bis(5'-nucleosyl)-tetraphosphatase (symmetrical)
MAIYAISDVQGCYDQLMALLQRLDFDEARDRLWLAGDLVNRGPDSLRTLRFVKGLGDSTVAVLGNHDLHLIALAFGNHKHWPSSSLHQVLEAPDRGELIDWLRTRPLLHHDPALDFTMIHAGLPPQWDLETAQARARELEAVLSGPECSAFLAEMYGDQPDLWDDTLTGVPRLRLITNCLTRMRYCDPQGRLTFAAKGPPGTQPAPFVPWFEVPGRKSRGERILFGHWSSLGYRALDDVWALDGGCSWGGTLTAVRLDLPEPQALHLPCPTTGRQRSVGVFQI